jgi:hypothetical protein
MITEFSRFSFDFLLKKFLDPVNHVPFYMITEFSGFLL